MGEYKILLKKYVYDCTEYLNKLVSKGKLIRLKNLNGKNIYRHGYFICENEWDLYIYRIRYGINSKYKKEPNTKIVEVENMSKDKLLEKLELNGLELSNGVDFILNHNEWRPSDIIKSIINMDYNNEFVSRDVIEFGDDEPLISLYRYIATGCEIEEF